MIKRVILYLPTIIIIGCADDMDIQIMQQDLNDDELVESNDSLLVTTQVKDEVDEPIPPKTPHSAALGLKFVQAAKTKVLPKSETFLSTEVQVDSIKPKNPLEEEDGNVDEPSTVIEKLAEFQSSLPTSQKSIELSDPITTPDSSSRESDTRARLHRGMPALNLWYSN